MRSESVIWTVVFVIGIFVGCSNADKADDTVNLVEKAESMFKTQGKEATLRAINDQTGTGTGSAPTKGFDEKPAKHTTRTAQSYVEDRVRLKTTRPMPCRSFLNGIEGMRGSEVSIGPPEFEKRMGIAKAICEKEGERIYCYRCAVRGSLTDSVEIIFRDNKFYNYHFGSCGCEASR